MGSASGGIGGVMHGSKSGPTEKVMELILELSADAHIERRQVEKDSAAFYSLTGAIAAYGRVLAHLTLLQELKELLTLAGQCNAPEPVVMVEGRGYVA
jgi:hypothetical protein